MMALYNDNNNNNDSKKWRGNIMDRIALAENLTLCGSYEVSRFK